jgi:GxxExxY protein
VIEQDYEWLSGQVIGAAIEVHRVLGPGLLESAYEDCLDWELKLRGVAVARQVAIPVRYKELQLQDGYRVDMIVNEALIVELKCIDAFQPVHTAQILTYLRMTGLKLGLLLNFKVDVMRKGVKRVVNRL